MHPKLSQESIREHYTNILVSLVSVPLHLLPAADAWYKRNRALRVNHPLNSQEIDNFLHLLTVFWHRMYTGLAEKLHHCPNLECWKQKDIRCTLNINRPHRGLDSGIFEPCLMIDGLRWLSQITDWSDTETWRKRITFGGERYGSCSF